MKTLIKTLLITLTPFTPALSQTSETSEEISQKLESYEEREILFDGKSTAQWVWHHDRTPIQWPIVEGALEVLPVEGHRGAGDGSIITKNNYEDFYLHVEFKPNVTPEGTREQGRGNSGIMLQDRYEIQVLDSYNSPLEGSNDCAAFYALKNADVNASKPAGEWQSYDIFFTAARWDGKQKIQNARVTVYWNGVLVHNNIELKSNTKFTTKEGPSPGPIRLQEHANPVQFRNIWIAKK